MTKDLLISAHKNNLNKKKAQAWGFDLMIAAAVFFISFVLLYLYMINITAETENILSSMKNEAESIANILLSEGYPINWDVNNVVTPGLITFNKINETKLKNFNGLANANYQKTRSLLQTRYNYYFNFSEPILIDGSPVQGIGMQNINAEQLIQINRVTIYKDKPITLILQIWE